MAGDLSIPMSSARDLEDGITVFDKFLAVPRRLTMHSPDM